LLQNSIEDNRYTLQVLLIIRRTKLSMYIVLGDRCNHSPR